MTKAFKILLIVGASLIFLGGIIFVIGMSVSGWNFKSLSNVTYEPKVYENNSQGIDNIQIEVDTANIEFKSIEGDKIIIEYNNVLNNKGVVVSELTPNVVGNTLNLKEIKKPYLSFNLLSSENRVTIKLPENKVFSIKAKTDTGDVTIGERNKETTFSKIDAETDTGKITVLGKVICNGNFKADLDTGYISTIGEIECLGNLEFETDTGKINLGSNITASSIKLVSDTGKITINGFIKANSIYVELDTGDVVCKTEILANTINVVSDTGDITLILKGEKSDYSYTYQISTGRSNIPSYNSGSNFVNVTTDTGDINISFKE